MKKILIAAGVVALTVSAFAGKNDDPVIMTVNGRPVYKSEFEYLYHKNASQQLEQQSLDQYVDMFVNYKLKVADALAHRMDTTAEFRKEISQYRKELAAPYMRDTQLEQQLLDEMYNRYARQRKVSHIMLAPATTPEEQKQNIALLDSIRKEVKAGRMDWAVAAQQYSIDKGTAGRGGSMGWLPVSRYPMAFEDAVYATAVGDISRPLDSGFGWHIVRVDEERANPGEVNARHILKLTARKSPEEAALAKPAIDSLYTLLVNGADFAEVARANSEDPGSASKGGELGWFGPGAMVAPFDSAAFVQEIGVISQPVATSFGWHIIQVTDKRGIKDRNEMTAELQAMLNESEKGNEPQKQYVEKLLKKYKAKKNDKNIAAVRQMLTANPGGYDSVMVAQLKASDISMATVDGNPVPMSAVMKSVPITNSKDVDNAMMLIDYAIDREMRQVARDVARDYLVKENPDYRNLVNEYTDGILLFDISQERVWQRAANDREGLQRFFKENREKYSFDEPRFKGYIIFTGSDSLETEVKDYLKNVKVVDPKTFSKELREKFGKPVRAERVIAKKGENAITDYLAFGADKPEASKVPWSNYFAFMGKIVEQPEEADDVRALVTADYQAALEKEWLEQLRSIYPVKINRKVLETVK